MVPNSLGSMFNLSYNWRGSLRMGKTVRPQTNLQNTGTSTGTYFFSFLFLTRRSNAEREIKKERKD